MTLREQAIDAAKQAINAGGYWLPPAGQEAAVDAVLSVVTPEAAARLGTPAGQSALDRILADAAHHDECANLSQTPEGAIAHSSMAAGLRIAAEHVRLGRDAELEASQRRAVRIQELLDDTRDRVRKLHRPARDSTWTAFGCDHGGGHESPCVHCQTCYPCPTITALEPPQETPEPAEPDSVLHAQRRHPDWEYATTEGPRKQWDDINVPPRGDDGEPDPTWERNLDAGHPGEGWERFDYTEESYWRRLKQPREK